MTGKDNPFHYYPDFLTSSTLELRRYENERHYKHDYQALTVLGENGKGYTKEANFISWNGNAAKLDIREWHPNHERCGKGITLTEDEGRNLYVALKTIYEKE